jgi:hypothetical protein
MRAEKLEDVLRGNGELALGRGKVEDEALVVVGVHESLEDALEYRRWLKQRRREASHEHAEAGSGAVPGVRGEIPPQETQDAVPGMRDGE